MKKMAAESPRRGSRGPGMCVRPQPVNDKTVMESVVDFFQDVAYSSGQRQGEDREKIQWIRFEEADLNDVNANPDCGAQSGNVAPLLLVLGYTNGVQVWSIAASGEAQEVLSLRQGPVRTLRLLKTPIAAFPDRVDIYANKRPLIALCDASSAGQPYCCVKFVSLRAGEEVHNVSFSYPVSDIKANDRVLIVAFPERIAAFDACQFKQTFWITSCYPAPGQDPNPIALGSRWLAYADRKLIPVHQSGGGMAGDGAQSYAATVISAAKTITKGLTIFGETVASSLTGVKSHSSKKEPSGQTKGDTQPGIVTVIDILNIGEGQISVQEDSEGEGLVAHFPAHTSEPIASMAFDPSGMMLLTADKLGHNFHLFRIMAHPWSCSLGAVHHLYTLHRGDTTAEIQDMYFTMDSRWVAVSTLRGTTHVFPITPYGGAVSVRTHTSHRVVNRASRFHRSAGIEDMEPRAAGRHSPIPVASGSPGSSPGRQEHYRNVLYQNSMNNNMGNPRLPPYPHPTTVHPVVQVKQTLSIPGMPSASSGSSKGKTSGPTSPKDDTFCVAACFAKSRGWVAGSPMATKDKTDDKVVDSLYICNWMGNVVEYVLEPRAKIGSEKVTDDSPLDVDESARAQWILSRSATSGELKPALASNNPLIIGNDAVVYQRPSSSDLLSSQGLMCRQESKESLSSDHSGSGPSGDSDGQWLSQVEIITHAGPHRRLWMGPQFSFKTFQGSSTTTVLSSNSSVLRSHSPEQTPTTMDIVSDELDLQSLKFSQHPSHESKPMKKMPKISHKEKRIAAFEESLKTWNPRPEIPDEPCEELPDWMDDVGNLGPRVVKSVDKIEAEVQEASRNITMKTEAQAQARETNFVMPKAVKINSKPWSSKVTPAKSKASQGKTRHHEVSNSANKKQTSSSEAQIAKEMPKATPKRCAKDTSNLATCDINPPVEEYFGKDKPEIEKESKTGKNVKIPGVNLDLPVAPVECKVKSNKKKKGNNSERPEVLPSKVEPIISRSSVKEAAAEEKESAKPKKDAKSVSNTDFAVSSAEGKIKESTTEDRQEISVPVAVSQAEITLKVKPSKEATPKADTATEEIPTEQSRKKKGKEKRGPKNDDNSTADLTAEHTDVKLSEEVTPEREVTAEEIPADKSKKKKGKEKRGPEYDDNTTTGVLTEVKRCKEATPESERSKKKKGKGKRGPERDENSTDDFTTVVHTEIEPSREATPESGAAAEEIPVENSKKKKSKERRGPESDKKATVDVTVGAHTEVKPSREASPESEAAAEEIPVEKSNRKKSKEKRDPGSDENSTVDFAARVHTEVKPSRETTPESEAAAEEFSTERSKKKKGKGKRGPESDENTTVDVTAGVHTEVKPDREATPESEAAAEEIPVEKSKKKKGKGKRDPGSDENSTVVARTEIKLKTTRKDAEEQKVKSPAHVKTNPWGKPMEKKEPKRDDELKAANKDAEAGKTQEEEVKSPAPIKTNPWSKPMEKKESKRDDELKAANKDAEAGKTQEEEVKSPVPMKTNPWGKPMERKKPEGDDKLKAANKDAEAGKTQEQKVKSPSPVKTNPWGKPMEKKEPKRDDELKAANKDAEAGKTLEEEVKSPAPVKTNLWGKPTEKKEPKSDDELKAANKNAEAGKTQEQKVKSAAPVKTNPWGKPMEKKEPKSDDNFSVDPPLSVARSETKLKIASKNTETCKTQELRVKPVDPVKTNPWGKSDGKGKEKRGPESDDNFSVDPLVSGARTETKLEIASKNTETSKTEEQKVKTVDPAKTNPWGKSDVTVSAKLQSKETSDEEDISIGVKTPGDRICVEANEMGATQAATRAKSEEKKTGAKVYDKIDESKANSQIEWSESPGKRGKGKKKRGKNKNGNNSMIETQAKMEEQSTEKNEVQQGTAKRAVALEKHQERLQPARSSPVAMPRGRHTQRHSSGSERASSPATETLLIEAGSYEQSPGLMAELEEQWPEPTAPVQSHVVDDRLRETLADAMLESPVKDNIGIGRYSKRDM